jgi:ABC-type protease/lipase transport system fused ATPase/permease subunit
MVLFLIGFFIAIGLAVLYCFVLIVMLMLGLPIDTKAGRARRRAIAEQMRQQSIEDEARRNLEVRAAEQQFGDPAS